MSFLPAISKRSAVAIRATIRSWRMASTRNNQRLEDLAELCNPSVRGWMNYYGRYYRSKCIPSCGTSQRVPLHHGGCKEIQRPVSMSRASRDALPGTHRQTGPKADGPVAARSETGG